MAKCPNCEEYVTLDATQCGHCEAVFADGGSMPVPVSKDTNATQILSIPGGVKIVPACLGAGIFITALSVTFVTVIFLSLFSNIAYQKSTAGLTVFGMVGAAAVILFAVFAFCRLRMQLPIILLDSGRFERRMTFWRRRVELGLPLEFNVVPAPLVIPCEGAIPFWELQAHGPHGSACLAEGSEIAMQALHAEIDRLLPRHRA
jgi:hypothetical protein